MSNKNSKGVSLSPAEAQSVQQSRSPHGTDACAKDGSKACPEAPVGCQIKDVACPSPLSPAPENG